MLEIVDADNRDQSVLSILKIKNKWSWFAPQYGTSRTQVDFTFEISQSGLWRNLECTELKNGEVFERAQSDSSVSRWSWWKDYEQILTPFRRL